jgi:EAL domain-containing protein (putative c-di-GMP-specific phosphodiesterase class I)
LVCAAAIRAILLSEMDWENDTAVVRRLIDFAARTTDLVGVVDGAGRLLFLNDAARKHLGVGDSTDVTTADLFMPEAFEAYFAEVRPALLRNGTWTGELIVRDPDGAGRPMLFSIVGDTGPGGEVNGLVAHARPVEGDDAATVHDRSAIHARLALARGRVAVLFAVITGVRGAPDAVLHAARDRLSDAARTANFVARIGRDSFVLLFEAVDDFSEVLRLAETVQSSFDRESGDGSVGLALGLALGEPDDDPEDLLWRAGAGVAGAKRGRRPHVVVDPEEIALTEACNALRLATTAGDVHTRVRPVVDLSGAPPHAGVIAYEGFARWTHRTVGTLEAGALQTLATAASVGTAIDLRVLRESAAVIATAACDAQLRIYAPISENLLDDVLAEHYVAEVIESVGIRPDQMHLLIDERFVPLRSMHSALRALRDGGNRLAVAGVNAGSDVVALIGDYHFRELVLAPDAIPAAPASRLTLRWVDAVVGIAHDAGARVIMPGVHTAARHELARALGFDAAIGDFYGRSVATGS